MQLRRIALDNFRNITRLELDFPPGMTVLAGDNAQGKSNILEAVYMFAAAKSVRAAHERDLIRRETLSDQLPFARVSGTVQRAGGDLHIEIVLQLSGPAPDGADAGNGEAPPLLKRIKVNHASRRAADLVGEVQAVLFEPQDIELVYGPPSLRRRHLDITLSQVDRQLLRELQRYNRVIAQRNPLLKEVREGHASPGELAFWDDELVASGAFITDARRQALAELDETAREVHRELTGGQEDLRLVYRPSVAPEPSQQTADAFRRALEAARDREMGQGVTVVGPHRDDLGFLLNGADVASFGSRGQERLATLSLKLAEARFMRGRTGEEPLVLLDDVLSELDGPRRRYLLERAGRQGQAVLTTANLSDLERPVLAEANLLRVAGGRVSPLAMPAAAPAAGEGQPWT